MCLRVGPLCYCAYLKVAELDFDAMTQRLKCKRDRCDMLIKMSAHWHHLRLRL